jgi:hypothetical protein
MPTSGVSTIGHGLGVVPQVIFMKARTGSVGWAVYHVSVGNGAYLQLNNAAASTVDANAWNNTSPTSSVFTIGTAFNNLGTYLAYCFAPIAGYSAFGSFVGNGTSDNTFVYTGFRPKFVMIKPTSGAGGNWIVQDTARDPYNVATALLNPDASGAEYTTSVIQIDFLSNGFKVRGSWGGYSLNPIYAAFAETPFKNSLAR